MILERSSLLLTLIEGEKRAQKETPRLDKASPQPKTPPKIKPREQTDAERAAGRREQNTRG